jgi:cysteine desulfurase
VFARLDGPFPSGVYLDHSATTPIAPEVFSAMAPYLASEFGNPSGAYRLGRRARAALEEARGQVAAFLGCKRAEVVFTSGGTESDNLALRGCAARALAGRRRHVVTTAIEHKAVLATAHDLEAYGFGVSVVQPDADGCVSGRAVAEAITAETFLVSAMLANNEIGTILPVREIADVARAGGALMHTDAVQAGPWLELDVDALGVDLLSLSAHKLYGPKGVGALYVREGTPIAPIQTGGGHEFGLRCGTENVAGAVGMAAALELVASRRAEASARVAALRDSMIERLTLLGGVRLTGCQDERLPGHVSICVTGAPADALLLGLDMRGIAASSGSACSSGRNDLSHVLRAIGIGEDEGRGALRLTMGHLTTAEEVDWATTVLEGLIVRCREHITA